MTPHFKRKIDKHTGEKYWHIAWYKYGRPIYTAGVYTGFWKAVKFFIKGWIYTFKYPTTVSKTFWQVLFSKLKRQLNP